MNSTVVKILGILAVIAPVAIDCLSSYLNKQPVNWNLLIGTISSALGGSQLIKRLEDTTPKHLDSKVEAKVAEALQSSTPPTQGP